MKTDPDKTPEQQAEALAALGQLSRLRIVQLLARTGPEGLPAGEIAQKLGLSQNGSSTHLSVLARAGLLTKRQSGKLAIYSVERTALRRLGAFVENLGSD